MEIEGAIFPTICDPLTETAPYTAFIPQEHIEEAIKQHPTELTLNFAAHRELYTGEQERLKIAFKLQLYKYEGELEVKYRMRLKALKWALFIESLLFVGLTYADFVIPYSLPIRILRWVMSTLIFWGFLILMRSTMFPAIGGQKYRPLYKQVQIWRKTLQTIHVRETVHYDTSVIDRFNEIDSVQIYEEMRTSYVTTPLGEQFYERFQEYLSPDESFVTKHAAFGMINSLKAAFDIQTEIEDFYFPIGEI